MTEAPQWFGDADALAEAVVREVGAPDVESLVSNAVKQKKQSASKIPERELLQRHVERVTAETREIEPFRFCSRACET
jgi:hypothetical protein